MANLTDALPEPAGFRTRYRSEPGMIGHYPWTYADQRRRLVERPEHEYEDLYTAEQLRTAVAAARAPLLAKVERLRTELAAVNNEFGSEAADWPEAWRRVAELKANNGAQWRELERLRADANTCGSGAGCLWKDAEIERLRAELERLNAENFALAAGQCPNVTADEGGTPRCAELEGLRAQVESLTVDAFRYRWLRCGDYPISFAHAVLNDTPHGIDTAIDKARGAA